MSDDFEQRVARMLGENVDAVAGPRRPAPPLRTDAERAGSGRWRRRAPWVGPLLAAACVAVIVGGTAGAVSLLSDKTPVTTQAPTPTPPPDTVAPAPTRTPTTPSSSATKPPASSHSSGQPGGGSAGAPPSVNAVTLDGSRIVLPQGWVARDFVRSGYGYGSTDGLPLWCLTPASRPVQKSLGEYAPPTAPGCPIVLERFDKDLDQLDVDTYYGTIGNPPQCLQGKSIQVQYADRDFGGRTADWRYYHVRCNAAHAVIERFMVATYPAIIMYSDLDTPQVHQAIASIAAQSTLTPQTRPLRLLDEGYVRSIRQTSSGIRVAIDRIVQTSGKITDNNPQTYTYDVPRNVIQGTPRVGHLAYLHTDGQRVTSFTT